MSPEPRTTPPTVLYVTARLERAAQIQQSIAEHGAFAVETATDGDEALERLTRSDEVDCLLSDYELPDGDGVELLETVREEFPDLPFVLWTDSGSESVASRAIAAGVTDYVQRRSSDDYQRLAARLQAALDGSERGAPRDSASELDESDRDSDGVDTDLEDEAAGQERERRYQTLVENLPGIVYRAAVDPSWPFEYVHGDCEAITGYSAETLREEIDWGHEIIHEDDRERVREVVEDALSGGDSFEVTYRIRRRDGTVRWLWERGQAVSEGVLEGFITDVTEQTQRERELERTRTMLGDAERLAAVGAFEYDVERDSLDWSDGIRRIFEVSSEFEPTADDVLDFCHPEDRERVDRLVTASRERGERYSTQLRIITASGRERWLHTEAKPVDGDGQPETIRGYVQDITDRKRRDQQVALLDRVLRQDLREDVNAIVDHAEAIGDATEGNAADSAEAIRSLGSSLLVLANKHREIANLVSEPQREQQFRVPELIERPVEEMRETYPAAELSVTVRDDGIVVASSELEEAVVELVDNAIQHNDRERPSVEVVVEGTTEALTIAVADDGPGMPDRELERIASSSDVDPLYHGEGLGLWLAQWIVNRSGGTLTFEENEPRGTVARISLPREFGSTPTGAELQRGAHGRS